MSTTEKGDGEAAGITPAKAAEEYFYRPSWESRSIEEKKDCSLSRGGSKTHS